MKTRFAIVVAAAMLALASAAPLWAQSFNGAPNGQKWQNFLNHHPKLAGQLQSNPSLLWNPNWRRQHPQLGQWIHYHQPAWRQMMSSQGVNPYQQTWQQFLSGHPKVSNQLQNNPNLLYNPTWRSRHPQLAQFLSTHPNVRNNLWGSAPTGMYPSTFGNFATSNPGIMQQLNANPGLANNPAYLAQHPQFADFMQSHPGFREDMRDRADYWHHHHSYEGWRWRHAWDDDGDAGPWMPPGLQHSHGHAYGWYRHNAGYGGPDADGDAYRGGREWHGHGHGDWGHGHGHGHGDWGHGGHGHHGHGGWGHGHDHD